MCSSDLAHMPMAVALEFSNAAAALNCTAVGARGHVPSRSEVDSLIALASAGKIGRREAPEILDQLAAQTGRSSVVRQ